MIIKLNCYVSEVSSSAIPIIVITVDEYAAWLAKQSLMVKTWLEATDFKVEAGQRRLIPTVEGGISEVVMMVASKNHFWDAGALPLQLPEGVYRFDIDESLRTQYAIGWGLGAYQFDRYKKTKRLPARLYADAKDLSHVANTVESIYQIRDWINTPTDDMGPSEFAMVAKAVADEFQAEFSQIVGDDLLKQNYASIYTVGRASDDAPRLVDMRWGNPRHPKVTLVGKGVCFDSGGLDIKPSSYMLLMKKDMAGGAHVFGLARMIMQAKLPVRLRVLVPVVENVISGNAYRPGDVIRSRSGLTIEVGNTDCEGRVILADALTEAVSESPQLLIDITTLTGAARVALGTELPAVFSNNDALVQALMKCGEAISDPMWRLPLHPAYREYINSAVADINNNSAEPYAGAITAALFLNEFVPQHIPWLHFDMMAWNIRAKAGRPVGGEAMAIRALFEYISKWCL